MSYTQGGQVEHRRASGGNAPPPPRKVNGFGWLLAAVVLAAIIGIMVYSSP